MAKKSKPAAPALHITADCVRDTDGYGALPFVECNRKNQVITRPQISACKALLLKAGFESVDVNLSEWFVGDDTERTQAVRKEWDDGATVANWQPQKEAWERGGWILVAVLYTPAADTDDGPDDAIAIMARPAGFVEQAQGDAPKTDAAWPFPKGKPGASGPDVQSEPQGLGENTWTPPATMTRDEASARKPGRFELLEPTDALLKTFTPRVEKHGEDDVSAASLGLQIEAPNTILDLLSSSLRPTLYAAADNGAKVDGKPASQRTIEGVEESTPLLRTKVIETLKLNNCYEGWTLRISWGFEEAMTISECKVDKFVVTPKDGGSVILDLRVGSSDIGEDEAGWLYGKLRHNIEITLHAPEPKPEPIDGTQGHPALVKPDPDDGPTAGDLFAEQHGGSGEREAEEQAS